MSQMYTKLKKAGIGAAVVILALVVAAGAVPLTGTASSKAPAGQMAGAPAEQAPACDTADPDTVATLEDRSKTYYQELKRLHSEYPDLVDREVLDDVKNQIEHGSNEKALGQYGDACHAFVRASEQARSALHLYYEKASVRNLDAVEQLLADAETSPPPEPDPDSVLIEQKLDQHRDQVAAADTLSERQRAHERTKELRREAEQKLPPTLLEQAAAQVNDVLLILVVIFGTATAIQGGYLLLQWRRNQNRTTGPDPYETHDN